MTDKVLSLMISYNGSDVKRINHALKVFAFASHISNCENCDDKTKTVISLAAILHDIGIHEAERIYKSSAGKYQEELGPKIAQELIEKLPIPEEIKNRVYYLIANHHSYDKIDAKDFQILVEADFLVNIFEDEMNVSAIESIKNKIFKTDSGTELLNSMYLGSNSKKRR
jgi:HD superfamily phosphodiesterase